MRRLIIYLIFIVMALGCNPARKLVRTDIKSNTEVKKDTELRTDSGTVDKSISTEKQSNEKVSETTQTDNTVTKTLTIIFDTRDPPDTAGTYPIQIIKETVTEKLSDLRFTETEKNQLTRDIENNIINSFNQLYTLKQDSINILRDKSSEVDKQKKAKNRFFTGLLTGIIIAVVVYILNKLKIIPKILGYLK